MQSNVFIAKCNQTPQPGLHGGLSSRDFYQALASAHTRNFSSGIPHGSLDPGTGCAPELEEMVSSSGTDTATPTCPAPMLMDMCHPSP